LRVLGERRNTLEDAEQQRQRSAAWSRQPQIPVGRRRNSEPISAQAPQAPQRLPDGKIDDVGAALLERSPDLFHAELERRGRLLVKDLLQRPVPHRVLEERRDSKQRRGQKNADSEGWKKPATLTGMLDRH
jgi:hypothetical protein